MPPSRAPRVPERPTRDAAAEARRRHALELLGDVLPDVTQDESGPGWGEADPGARSRDDDLRRDVPPHHGG